jgi:hypothetical protein
LDLKSLECGSSFGTVGAASIRRLSADLETYTCGRGLAAEQLRVLDDDALQTVRDLLARAVRDHLELRPNWWSGLIDVS